MRFDLAELGPIGPWLSAYRALALTATKDDALGGARYGRVTLEAYQVAPALRILAKPRPRLLTANGGERLEYRVSLKVRKGAF